MSGKSHPVGRAILASWRRLTGGNATRDEDRRTLVALSGGADSTALLLALASQPRSVAAAHVVHDMRPAPEAEGDRAACERLCAAVGVAFVSRAIAVRGAGGNLEATARRARYEALRDLALETGCRFVATGHHAEDQMETLLMRLLRGSGLHGMSGIRARRGIGSSVVLMRPMLSVGRADAERLCRDLGVAWRTDATNADVRYLRARLRREVMPALLAIAPQAPRHAVSVARAMADAGAIMREAGEAALGRAAVQASDQAGERGGSWSRDALRREPPGVLREAAATLVRRGGGTVRRREIAGVVRAIRSDDRTERRFEFEGCVLRVGSSEVLVEPRGRSLPG